MDNHPGCVLCPVDKVLFSRQDMVLEAPLSIYMNQEVNIEFLDYSLIMPGKRCNNILMKKQFVIGLAINGSAISVSMHCLFFDMHSHALVSREDARA